jgi:hypothetical protein
MPLTWPQVLSWRQRRHFLDRAMPAAPVEVARRLVGLQAQVMSSAEQAVAVRTPAPAPDALAARLAAVSWYGPGQCAAPCTCCRSRRLSTS